MVTKLLCTICYRAVHKGRHHFRGGGVSSFVFMDFPPFFAIHKRNPDLKLENNNMKFFLIFCRGGYLENGDVLFRGVIELRTVEDMGPGEGGVKNQ